jgi:ABC-2 type transport system permease protein
MSLKKTWAVMKKESRHIVRATGTFLMVTLSPVFLLIAMGFAFTVDIKNTPVAIIDRDHTSLSRAYLSKLAENDDLDIRLEAENHRDIERWLEQGRVKAAVVIPERFAQDIRRGQGSELQVLIDGTDPNTAEQAARYISLRAAAFAEELAVDNLDRQGVRIEQPAPIDLRMRTWYNSSLKISVGIIPALVAVVLTMPAVSASLAVTREKEYGTMEGLIATPISRADLLIGKLVPYVLSGLLSAVLCALTAVLLFGVPFRGNWLLYMLLSADFLLATLGASMLISMLVRTQDAAMVITLLAFMFPGFFLSGIFFPLVAMPPESLMEAYMFPTTHYVYILRGILLKGQGLDILWPYALALLAMGLLFSALAVLLFKKKLS